MRTEIIRDHFLGMLFGMAIGDALGSPHEGQTGAALRMKYEGKELDMAGSRDRRLQAGEWCDDMAQALLLVESLNSLHDFDGVDLASRLSEWGRTNPRGASELTRRVIRIFENDIDFWSDAGRSCWYESAGTEAGSGALARCMIAGLFYNGDIHKMVDRTIQICRITHFDPRCVEAALALNFTLIQLLHLRLPSDLAEQTLAFLEATRSAREWKRQVLGIDRGILARYSNFTPYPTYFELPDEVTDALKKMSRFKHEDLRTTGRAADTAISSIWCATHAPSFEEAMRMAVLLGGKTDTQAALTGALAGARFGLARIPRDWMAQVKQSQRILALGEVMLTRSMREEERDFEEGKREPVRKPPPMA